MDRAKTVFCLLLSVLLVSAAFADGGVTFTDIADGGGAGITFERTASTRAAIREALISGPPIPNATFFGFSRPFLTPQKGRGAPGVAVLDYDDDGDLDIYATNGPGSANSLFQNQLIETGSLSFIDRGVAAGVDATGQDSSGVCFGDIDNDGDQDLYVLGTGEANLLFENLGNGTFDEITAAAGVGGDGRHAIACSFLDIDNDGLLDVVVGNSYNSWDHRQAVFVGGPTYNDMEHNYLFRNTGGNLFDDVSATAGIEDVSNMSGPGLTGAAFTWAIGSADYDLDGDTDIFSMDNQGAGPADPSQNRGYIRIYDSNGGGGFTEATAANGTDVVGGWMGVDFADFDCDGNMDFFATDLGYIGAAPSRWFLGSPGGTFTDSGAGDLIMTPFGWGTSVIDYDNDGDSDVIYHGGVDLTSIILADNPGALLQNTGTCSANFDYDSTSVLKNHVNRMVNGVAVGDLNNDGFEDVVSISAFDVNPLVNLPFIPIVVPPSGSPFDASARFEVTLSGFPVPGSLTYIGRRDPVTGAPVPHPNGTLSVEVNSADNGNGWAAFDLVGSAGYLSGGTVNRDGIGAVAFFTPDGSPTSMQPIVGGASYASQNSLTANFGLGAAAQGTLEVLWPGGVRNRLYDVADGESLVMPHIPCSYDADWKNFGKYNSCVMQALNAYKNAGLISAQERNRLRDSARRAYDEAQ